MDYRISYVTVLAVITCALTPHSAPASEFPFQGENRQCDTVRLNGTARMLENGQLVGSESLTGIDTGEQREIHFTMDPLGTVDIDPASSGVTLATTHDFTSRFQGHVTFTTIDTIRIIPLGGTDPTCMDNPCGLIFTLDLVQGRGQYNCGQIVSGYDTDPGAAIPFTSFVNPLSPAPNGDTVFLNSRGKLCRCSGNN